jgi:hypothetical protein
VQAVECLRHDGQVDPVPYELCQTHIGPGIRLHVTDSGGDALYYRVAYQLA